MALNYWFHPPSMTGSFEAPYNDNYWADNFKEMVAGGNGLWTVRDTNGNVSHMEEFAGPHLRKKRKREGERRNLK
jgi:hypothetical protein